MTTTFAQPEESLGRRKEFDTDDELLTYAATSAMRWAVRMSYPIDADDAFQVAWMGARSQLDKWDGSSAKLSWCTIGARRNIVQEIRDVHGRVKGDKFYGLNTVAFLPDGKNTYGGASKDGHRADVPSEMAFVLIDETATSEDDIAQRVVAEGLAARIVAIIGARRAEACIRLDRGETCAQVAADFGVTESRVSQMRSESRRMVKALLGDTVPC